MNVPSFDLHSLRSAYSADHLTPSALVGEIYARIAQRGADSVWIHLLPEADALAYAQGLEQKRAEGKTLPLYGIPFAVKDNIDVAGLPTTAACPDFKYIAAETATAVQRLLDAGAMLIGKTNLDQFAAGLVGVRSPYGAPSSVFNSRYISGGSSSGSSVAVAAGLVSFALGTDTAGSGRVPAGFNNLIGWKPTRGFLSTRGVVPACRSLDCVSVFSLTAADAQAVAKVAGVFDGEDPYSRVAPPRQPSLPASFRFGVPAPEQLAFFGDKAAEALFQSAVARLIELGGVRVEIDYTPFRETADLLYSGPWLAERFAAIQPFIEKHPHSLHPVTAKIIGGGARYSAVDTFTSFYRLEALRRQAEAQWQRMDVLFLPTSGTTYTLAEVEADPVQLNTNLGYYTNFVNLLDLCGVSVPSGFRPNGLPFGVTLLGRAFADEALLALSGRYHRAVGGIVGGTTMHVTTLPEPVSVPSSMVQLAVVGAHLSGQPLNYQLNRLGASLVKSVKTASGYRLFALPDTVPLKPGLVRAPDFAGPGIEVEVWSLDEAGFGNFVAAVPPPLAIGSVELADGTTVKGFVCEPFAVGRAEEITTFGGWRAYLGSLSASKAGSSPVHVPAATAPTSRSI